MYTHHDKVFPKARLVIFSKAPVAGQVKTRLTKTYSAEVAAGIHARLTEHSVSSAVNSNLCPVELWCAPDIDHPFFKSCRQKYRTKLVQQQGDDLGERMSLAFASVLAKCDYAIIIGTDCPDLSHYHIKQSLSFLEKGGDVVLGPAKDGGYVLIGLKKPRPNLFSQVKWGTSEVCAVTRQRIDKLGLRVLSLEPLDDIDRPQDVTVWRRNTNNKGLRDEINELLFDVSTAPRDCRKDVSHFLRQP